ncbi:MAG TPA: MBL fold metallo-hydrolase [Isosphaeraceae bacterium]|nr:MBL fold metallo-hydrolase [Isosphaeraceae bacterium]
MSGLRLVPLGVGEAFSAKRYTTSLALETQGTWLLIDCSHPIRKMMHEAGTAAGIPLDIDQFSAAVITHLHADHSSGLEIYGYYSYFRLRRRARLVVHPEVAAGLWAGHLASGMEHISLRDDEPIAVRQLDDYFELVYLDEARAVDVGPFSIECRRTVHAVPTTALRIKAAGRVLGFSADTAFDPSLIDWLAPADMILHEATFGEHTGLHTPYSKLAALPENIRKKMRITHYPDAFDLEASIIEPIYQGRSYEV